MPDVIAVAETDARLAGLPPQAIGQMHAAARAIRDGNIAAAMKLLEAVLAGSPDHPEALRLCAIAHMRCGRHAQAQAALHRVLEQQPDDALALTDMGNVQQAAGHSQAALASWRRACAAAPQEPTPWFNLGRNLHLQGATEAATEALVKAHALAPDFLPALVLLGDALVHLGQFEQAAAQYRKALALHPACGDAWRGLSSIKTHPLGDTDREQLAAMLDHPDLAPGDRIAIGFALGKVCEDQGRYPEAFAALNEANARLRQLAPWRAGGFRSLVDAALAASATPGAPLDDGLGSEVIFIVGLPRSGSTLFEQILAAHPQVEGASELQDLEQIIGEESARRSQPFPRWVPAATAQDWQRLGRQYLERTAHWRRTRPRHTDKLPGNWLFTGVLAAMLPGARIIDARRDPMEAGWSCFKQQFYRLPHFSCTLTDIAAYTRDYQRAMDAWQAERPQRIRIQRYEALLADSPTQIRELLAFCDLPFDAACLDFHRARRSVRTASAAQVRQPLQRDTARAAHYGPLLDPLRFGLGLPRQG